MRGQLSTDVLLAMIAAAVFFSVLAGVFLTDFSAGAKKAAVDNEAKAILLDVYAATGSAYFGGTQGTSSIEVAYSSPSPRILNLISCDVKFDKAQGSIEVTVATEGYKATKVYSGMNLSLPNLNITKGTAQVQSFSCGDEVVMKLA